MGEKDGLFTRTHGVFWRKICSLSFYDDGFAGVYIYQNSTYLNMCSLLNINYTSIMLGKKDLQKCKTMPHFSQFFDLKTSIIFIKICCLY